MHWIIKWAQFTLIIVSTIHFTIKEMQQFGEHCIFKPLRSVLPWCALLTVVGSASHVPLEHIHPSTLTVLQQIYINILQQELVFPITSKFLFLQMSVNWVEVVFVLLTYFYIDIFTAGRSFCNEMCQIRLNNL